MQQNTPRPWQDVPASVAPLLRERLPGTAAEIIAAVRAEVPEYDQPLEGEFGRLISEGVDVALDQFVDLLGSDVARPKTGIYAAMGRAELDAGRTLDALQSAYRTGARVAWRRVVADTAGRVDPTIMYALAEAIFAYIDLLADASVAAYAQAQSAREGFAQARRHALVELLVGGPVADARAARELARDADWELPSMLAVVAPADGDPAALARRAPAGTIGAALEAGPLLLVPDPDGPGRRGALELALLRTRAAIGPTVPWAQAAVSARRAVTAVALLREGRLGDAPLVRSDDHRIALLLAADPQLAEELVTAHLGALRELGPAPRARALATLRAWLDAHGDVTATAAALHVHPQSVRYRLARLRETLGDDALDDPLARLELTLALRAPGAP